MSMKKRATKSIALALVGITVAIPTLNTVSAMEKENKASIYQEMLEDADIDLEEYFGLISNCLNMSGNSINFDKIKAIELGIPIQLVENLDETFNEMDTMVKNKQLIIENNDIEVNKDLIQSVNSDEVIEDRASVSVSWTSASIKFSKAECKKISNALAAGADVAAIIGGMVSIGGGAFAAGVAAIIAGVASLSSKMWAKAANGNGVKITAKVTLPSLQVRITYSYL